MAQLQHEPSRARYAQPHLACYILCSRSPIVGFGAVIALHDESLRGPTHNAVDDQLALRDAKGNHVAGLVRGTPRGDDQIARVQCRLHAVARHDDVRRRPAKRARAQQSEPQPENQNG